MTYQNAAKFIFNGDLNRDEAKKVVTDFCKKENMSVSEFFDECQESERMAAISDIDYIF